MILPFSQKFPWGEATNFDLKITRSLVDSKLVEENYTIGLTDEIKPKHHTIREDKKDRWKQNRIIHAYYNNRQPDMRLIAPAVPCVSTQVIKISWIKKDNKKTVRVSIDGMGFGLMDWVIEPNKTVSLIMGDLEQLAHNDGFDSVEDFFKWFDKDFKGKIIHWTDLRY